MKGVEGGIRAQIPKQGFVKGRGEGGIEKGYRGVIWGFLMGCSRGFLDDSSGIL